MEYVGLQTQISRNNIRSVVLLVCFPLIILGLTWLYFFLITGAGLNSGHGAQAYYEQVSPYEHLTAVNDTFVSLAPLVLGIVAIWFLIAYFANTAMINGATGSRPLERRENARVYNLVENLCISKGMKMPKINIIDTDQMNAFASGMNEKNFTVTLTRGIINMLTDDELEGVIAHELTHIRNRDVRLLIISIVFVGIFSFLTSMLLRMFFFGNNRRRDNDKGGQAMIIALVLAAVGYFITILLKFALSRKREYLADAGAAEMTHKPLALASALRKIAGHSDLPDTSSAEVSQLYIENDHKSGFFSFLGNLFATHPPIEKRIALLEQM